MHRAKEHITKKVLALILSAVFILPVVFQSVHICYSAYDETHDTRHEHKGHSEAKCAVCHFSLSSFTETEDEPHTVFLAAFDSETRIAQQQKAQSTTTLHHFLRAPPVV